MNMNIILFLFFIAIASGITLLNNAKIWPPTMLAYIPIAKKNDVCPLDVYTYNILNVGQNDTPRVLAKEICVSYTPDALIWTAIQKFNSSIKELTLNAQIVKHQLEFWYSLKV